ncbi:hypothetical protein [Kaistia nematophila]|uniref:Uncharacterized protein n=1 Tax=Kaistia nematophila TaxID=2994654 RepID=A0A9X3IMI8_9HYPH|nr:hypothetical protein [Kaistia nematophila]MCX5570591.1 hypothetical protein [Kaistia nematophila]
MNKISPLGVPGVAEAISPIIRLAEQLAETVKDSAASLSMEIVVDAEALKDVHFLTIRTEGVAIEITGREEYEASYRSVRAATDTDASCMAATKLAPSI